MELPRTGNFEIDFEEVLLDITGLPRLSGNPIETLKSVYEAGKIAGIVERYLQEEGK